MVSKGYSFINAIMHDDKSSFCSNTNEISWCTKWSMLSYSKGKIDFQDYLKFDIDFQKLQRGPLAAVRRLKYVGIPRVKIQYI